MSEKSQYLLPPAARAFLGIKGQELTGNTRASFNYPFVTKCRKARARPSGCPAEIIAQSNLSLFLFLATLEARLDLEQPIKAQNIQFLLPFSRSTLLPTQHTSPPGFATFFLVVGVNVGWWGTERDMRPLSGPCILA